MDFKLIPMIFLLFTSACKDKSHCISEDVARPLIMQTSSQMPINKKPDYYTSCQEIKNETLEAIHTFKSLQPSYSSYSNQCEFYPDHAFNSSPAENTNQPTNTQEKNIDEADLVKISKNYIFYARSGRIEVLNRYNLDFIKSLPFYVHEIPKIYVIDEKLVVIHGYFDEITLKKSTSQYTPRPRQIQVSFYDLSAGFKLLDNKIIAGEYIESRLTEEGQITVFTQTPLDTDSYNSLQNEKYINSALKDIDCEKVLRPFVNDHDFNITNIHSFSIHKNKILKKSSHLSGSFKDFYLERNLFLSKQSKSWIRNNQIVYSHKPQQIIVGFENQNQSWQQSSFGIIDGQTIGSWSYKQKDNYLFVATERTQGDLETKASSAIHVLKMIDQNLVEVETFSGIAPLERLKAVRYVDHYAYLVTFLETDPLYVFDLTEPESIQYKGELKVPGFSTYLHPVGNDRLAGIGRNENGHQIQMSLFEVSKSGDPKTITQLSLNDSGSSSIAESDHHAFYFDPLFQRVAIPFESYSYHTKVPSFDSGAYLLRVEKNNLTFEGKINHKDMQSQCQLDLKVNYDQSSFRNISRIIKIDDRMLSFSDFGVKEHSQIKPDIELQKIVFPNSQDFCPQSERICTIMY